MTTHKEMTLEALAQDLERNELKGSLFPIRETIKALQARGLLAALKNPSDAGGDAHDAEWFFRWIARGKANYTGMTMEQCADMIWHSPANPYRENNPWEDKTAPPQADTPIKGAGDLSETKRILDRT